MWLLSSRKTRGSSPARSHRLCLEALEDRCLLSAGALDPTFGNGGYVTTSTSAYGDGAPSALIQPNGDIVALGGAQTSSAGAFDFAAERYTVTGSLDPSFGLNGIALTSFGSGTARGPHSALDPYAGTSADGNDDVVQEGVYATLNGSASYQALVRYKPDGTLDTTFGTNGEVMTAFPGMRLSIPDGGVVVTSTGQIVAFSDTVSGGQFVLACYNANGTLDINFGGNNTGYVITSPPAGDGYWSNGLLQLPNGDLIVTYAEGFDDSGGVWAMYCFKANGTLDTTFGTGGLVTTTTAGGPVSAALYPAGTPNAGQIVVAGENGAPPELSDPTWELARYNANGTLDTTFGTGGTGFMQTQISGDPSQVTIDANGRIVVAGDNAAETATELARFNGNGTPDTTFGNGGVVTTTFGTSSAGLGVAIYPNAGTANDGDIVVVGGSNNGTKGEYDNVLVARYLPQATSPYFVITGPPSLAAGTSGNFTISVLNPDGSADTGYSGTVQITSSDPQAVLPANFTIANGSGTFTATLKTAGLQSLTATDTVTASINGTGAGITVNPAAATHFVLSGPSSVKSGTAFSLTITALDAYGNVATGYTGTVQFTDSVSGATLPANYKFTAADAGVYTFTGLKLKTKGTQTITVTDTLTDSIIGSLAVSVT